MANLFSPCQIENLALSNRLVMPPMALDIASEQGEVTAGLVEHYLLRARAHPAAETEGRAGNARPGIGLVIVEHSYVSPGGRAHPRQLGIDNDLLLPGLQLLAAELHGAGVPAAIQISHAGARALASPAAPSRINSPHLSRYGKQQAAEAEDLPHELSKTEIKQLVKKFAEAALRAKKAGFDVVEIHGAHGYLLNQFYSPLTNHRKDAYGGTLEKRLRFPLEVIAAVREAVGPEMPVFYRLGADDRLPGGNSIAESVQAVPYLVEAGVSCLDLSGGLCGYLKSGPEGFFTYLAEAIKPVTGLPVLVTGGIRNVQTADKLITAKKADLVGIGRALLADAGWARKAWLEMNR